MNETRQRLAVSEPDFLREDLLLVLGERSIFRRRLSDLRHFRLRGSTRMNPMQTILLAYHHPEQQTCQCHFRQLRQTWPLLVHLLIRLRFGHRKHRTARLRLFRRRNVPQRSQPEKWKNPGSQPIGSRRSLPPLQAMVEHGKFHESRSRQKRSPVR